MKIYSLLSKVSFLKNRYVAKFLFITFLGITVPAILSYVLFFYGKNYLAPLDILIILVVLTIIATILVVNAIKGLLIPINLASKALLEYVNGQTVAHLPSHLTDEAGVMLKNIQTLVYANQKLLNEKRDLCEILTTDLRDRTANTEQLIAAIYNESNDSAIKKMASNAAQSVKQQISFVDKYVEILSKEEHIFKQPIKVRKINIQELLDDVKIKFKSALASKNVVVQYSLKISRVRLKVSSTLLEQAIGYIFEFLLKSAPENSKIEVLADKNRGKLLLQIRDYGTEVSNAEADKIFEKFHALAEENQEESKAPGIGLYLCNQIMDRFGGTVIAEPAGKTGGIIISLELRMYR